jgi:hypothetical protein
MQQMDEPDDDVSGMKMRRKACKNGKTGVKAYGKFQPSGISDKSQVTSHKSPFVMLSSLSM